VLVLSFGLIELRTSRTRGDAPRLDLSASSPVRRVLRWPPLVFVLRALTVALFLLIIAAGLFGHQSPAMNVAPLLTWTIWWVGLVFLVLYLGKAWCTVCPWDAIATWVERLRFWGPRRDGLGLQLRWPSSLRNIWFAVALFVLLTWIELGAGITVIPRATAWVALGMLGLAVASALIFERKAFCRYACLVGRVSGLYALFSSTELRASRSETCRSCRSLDCYHGNDRGDGCPTHQVVRTMDQSTYCTLCLECVRTCPHDNVSVRLRPWGADLLGTAHPRRDEAFLSLILLAMTSFHGLTMTPRWAEWNAGLRQLTGLAELTGFSLLMLAALVAPIVLFWGLSALAARWSRSGSTWTVFLHYAYALLPIALFYHLAHNAEHFLIEGPKVLALISDPFGWGWNLFGTARWIMPPLISLEGLWGLQVLLVLVGHVYGLWISSRITRRLIPERRRAVLGQLPMLAAMVAFSVLSLWLLAQPMEMRVSAM
jgi:polyferredoxin